VYTCTYSSSSVATCHTHFTRERASHRCASPLWNHHGRRRPCLCSAVVRGSCDSAGQSETSRYVTMKRPRDDHPRPQVRVTRNTFESRYESRYEWLDESRYEWLDESRYESRRIKVFMSICSLQSWERIPDSGLGHTPCVWVCVCECVCVCVCVWVCVCVCVKSLPTSPLVFSVCVGPKPETN